jgi:hypothetical protein
MNDLDQVKEMLDKATSQAKLLRHTESEFKALQKEIALLYERARVDPGARRKLASLEDLMKGEGKVLLDRVVESALRTEQGFRRLSSQVDKSFPHVAVAVQARSDNAPAKRDIKKGRRSKEFV